MTWSSASAHRLLCDLKFCSSASTHGLFFGLKFRLRIRNILRLKVPQFRFRIQNNVWLGTLKWRNSASAQGKYCGLEVTQLRFHTINLVRLEVSQFRFHTRALTLSLAVPPPHKEYPVTWSSSVSHNILWLEFPQFRFRKKRRHLKFRTSASAREHYFSLEYPLIQPPTHFLIFVLTYMTDGPSEGQRNKRIGMLLAKVVVNVWLREDL